MNEFLQEILNMGGCLTNTQSDTESEGIIKDAEELYRRHIEQLNKPCVSNNEERVAVCDHVYPLNYNMLVPKDHNCIKCGKPRKQTDC